MDRKFGLSQDETKLFVMDFSELPTENLREIFSYLEWSVLFGSIPLVSKEFNLIVNDEVMYKILIEQRFDVDVNIIFEMKNETKTWKSVFEDLVEKTSFIYYHSEEEDGGGGGMGGWSIYWYTKIKIFPDYRVEFKDFDGWDRNEYEEHKKKSKDRLYRFVTLNKHQRQILREIIDDFKKKQTEKSNPPVKYKSMKEVKSSIGKLPVFWGKVRYVIIGEDCFDLKKSKDGFLASNFIRDILLGKFIAICKMGHTINNNTGSDKSYTFTFFIENSSSLLQSVVIRSLEGNFKGTGTNTLSWEERPQELEQKMCVIQCEEEREEIQIKVEITFFNSCKFCRNYTIHSTSSGSSSFVYLSKKNVENV